MTTFQLLDILLYTAILFLVLGAVFGVLTFMLNRKYKPAQLKTFIHEEAYRLANRKKVIISAIPEEKRTLLHAVYRPLPNNVSTAGWAGSLASSQEG